MQKNSAASLLAISAALLFSPSTHASAKPLYREATPRSFCASGKSLGLKVEGCEGNGIFLQSAKDCLAKLEDTQKRVTQDLNQVIGSPAVGDQNAAYHKSKMTYEEGIAAHDYMFKLTQLALKEVDAYFDEVVYPDHAETDAETMAQGCFRDTVVPMNSVADQIKEKLVAIAGKIETAELEAKGLKADSGNVDSLTAPGAASSPAASGSTGHSPKGKRQRQSDISGTKPENKPAPQPKK